MLLTLKENKTKQNNDLITNFQHRKEFFSFNSKKSLITVRKTRQNKLVVKFYSFFIFLFEVKLQSNGLKYLVRKIIKF